MTIAAPRDRPRLSGTNLERAADHNQRVTLHAIRVSGSLTRVELAEITGLTAPAIANITKRLLQDGLIEEAGRRLGGRGQPPTKLVIRRDACHAIGVNIDRDHITIVLVDFAGQTVARVSRDMDYALPGDVRTLYRQSIKTMLRRAGVSIESVVGLGIAMPDDLGKIELPGRPQAYSSWEDVNLADLFAEPFALPVFTENDAAAAAMGEMQLGLGQQFNSFFYILISAGLGGGLVVDGNYVRGATGRSGEIGLMRSAGADMPGEQVQTLVSLSALADRLGAQGFGLDAVKAGEWPPALAACIDTWIEDAADRLTGPLEAVNCLINPATILLGGRLPLVLLDRLAARINTRVQAVAGFLPTVAPVARAALSDDAPAVGAAILPFSHYLLPTPGALWKVPNEGQSEPLVA
ncbi:ROK family transcriptional regulator [Sphingomonas sp. KR3-1]|uniref:ROK family transcriptional regulator n=1 Tax=Sphingomonas sp. KR3-1 TaxID=3156611 RepID=UPI0032B41688